MHGRIYYLIKILILLILIILITQVSPQSLVFISDKTKLTDVQIQYILGIIPILLEVFFEIPSLIEQKLAERKYLFDFVIMKDSLSLESYKRFPTELKDAYGYSCNLYDENIEKPYYEIEVELEKNAVSSIDIPLLMEVSTELFGESIEFSNLIIIAGKNGKIVVNKNKPYSNLLINKPIRNNKKFLIRILLLCNHELEQVLLDSCFYLSIKLIFTDDRGRKHKKYLIFKIQNTMGESNILGIITRNNWLLYRGEIIKQQYNKKRKKRCIYLHLQ